MSYGLKELVDDWGGSLDDILMEGVTDGVCASICTNCGYTTEMEPDQNRGYCEECGMNTVKSALVLAGMI